MANDESNKVDQHIVSTAQLALDAPISCLSFSPQSSDILIVGTYELQHQEGEVGTFQSQQVRKGSLYVLLVTQKIDMIREENVEAGILDLKFSPADGNIFAIATSNGFVELFRLDQEQMTVIKDRSIAIEQNPVLVLYLAWYPRSLDADEFRIAMSLSDGRIAVLNTHQGNHEFEYILAHDLEAWFVAWNPLNGSQLYSGGDDSYFCVSEVPVRQQVQTGEGNQNDEVEGQTVFPFYRNRKIHEAGVTSILPYPFEIDGEKIIFSGSYDETLRVLGQKNGTSNWFVKKEIPLGGGVWRLKVLGNIDHTASNRPRLWSLTVLASCMHAGPKIIRIGFDGCNPVSTSVLAEFREHTSMNYASDTRSTGISRWDIVSSSFYDKKLCLWQFAKSSGG